MPSRAPPPAVNGNGATNAKGTKSMAAGRPRAAISAARRANQYRTAKGKGSGNGIRNKEKGTKYSNKKKSKLSYEETIQLMNRRKQKDEDITAQDPEELEDIEGIGDEADPTEATQLQEDYTQRVSNTKVPLHGNLHVERKHDEAVRLCSLNINSLSFWLRNNYKAEHLKHVLQQYGVDSIGIQEVCINWSAFKSS